MKKVIVSAIAIVMTLVLLASCGALAPSIEGVYKTKTIDGKTPLEYFEASAEESGVDLDTLLGIFSLSGQTVTRDDLNNYVTIDLQKDGKAILSSFLEEDADEGTWEKKDNAVTITIDGDPQEFKLENGELTVEMDGVKIVLAK